MTVVVYEVGAAPYTDTGKLPYLLVYAKKMRKFGLGERCAAMCQYIRNKYFFSLFCSSSLLALFFCCSGTLSAIVKATVPKLFLSWYVIIWSCHGGRMTFIVLGLAKLTYNSNR